MNEKYGFTNDQWEKAKEEMRQVLMATARKRGIIPYSELVARVETIRIKPESQALAAMLGEISRQENASGRGMLTVLVVHKSGDYQPGPGFFELAKELGRDTSDLVRCWVEELKKVHDCWASLSSSTNRDDH